MIHLVEVVSRTQAVQWPDLSAEEGHAYVVFHHEDHEAHIKTMHEAEGCKTWPRTALSTG